MSEAGTVEAPAEPVAPEAQEAPPASEPAFDASAEVVQKQAETAQTSPAVTYEEASVAIDAAIAELSDDTVSADKAFKTVHTALDVLSAYDNTTENKDHRDDNRAATHRVRLAYNESYSLDPTAGMDGVVLSNVRAANGGALPDEFILDSEEETALRATAIEHLQRAGDIIEGNQATLWEQTLTKGNDLAAGFLLGPAIKPGEHTKETLVGEFIYGYTLGNLADVTAIGGNTATLAHGVAKGNRDQVTTSLTNLGVHTAALVVPDAIARRAERAR
jgi:hypothetical protein